VNTLGESLSKINLENHSVTANAATLGLFTNQVVVRGEKAYVVNSGVNEIQVIDLATLNTSGNIDAGQGTNPWAMEFINDTLAAVSLLFTNQVVFINVNTGEIVKTVTVGIGPEGLLYYNGKVYVANSGFVFPGFEPGVVSVINMNDFSVSEIPVGVNPQALEVDSQGNIIVACTGNYADIGGELDIIDSSADTVLHAESINASITFVAVNSADKAYLATYGSGVLVYDLPSRQLELDESNALPGGPGLAIDFQNNVYISDFGADTVRVFSPSHNLLNAYLVGDGPISIALFENAPNAISVISNQAPEAFTLYQNYPNPFNPQTTIRFELRQGGPVSLDIFNALGEKIATPVQEFLPAGSYELSWEGKDAFGNPLPSGIYFYQLRGNGQSLVKKMILAQ
jgi:hypothetical protein